MHPERADGPLPAPVPESALYPVVARALVVAGFECYRDVSFLGRWIDLYAKKPCGETVSVELKVKNWQKALQQAVHARGAADRTYVAIWAPYVHRCLTAEAVELFAAEGIGLLSVNGTCEVKLEASERNPLLVRWVILPSRASHRPQ